MKTAALKLLLCLLTVSISIDHTLYANSHKRSKENRCLSCKTPHNKPCNILCNVCKPSCSCKPSKKLSKKRGQFNWPSYGRDFANTRHAVECKINSQNVSTLEQKWTFNSTPVAGNPAIVDDILYFGSAASNFGPFAGSVYALNAQTGTVIWQRLNVIPFNPDSVDLRTIALTPAVGCSSVYVAGANGVVIALDRFTGNTLAGWPANGVVVNTNPGQSILSALVLLEKEDLLFVCLGNFIVSPIAQGSIVALRASTGALVWRFDTTSNPSNPLTTGGPGVGIFGTPALDTKRGLLFIGTGENYPPTTLATITPIADSLLAFNYRTSNPDGDLIWHVQFTSDDIFDDTVTPPVGKDWDASSGPYLLTVKNCNGTCQDVVIIASKEGKIRSLDRATGTLIWTTVLTNPNPQGSPLGGANTFGCTDKDVIYVPSHYTTQGLPLDFCTVYDPTQTATGIFAVRASDGAILWRTDVPGGTVGPLTVANGVLYHTTTNGTLRAYDVRNGSILFEFQNPPVGPDPICPANLFNALLGGTTVYKGMVYLPFGTGAADFAIPPVGPGGIIAFGLPS